MNTMLLFVSPKPKDSLCQYGFIASTHIYQPQESWPPSRHCTCPNLPWACFNSASHTSSTHQQSGHDIHSGCESLLSFLGFLLVCTTRDHTMKSLSLPHRSALLSPTYRWGEGGLERLCTKHKVTQPYAVLRGCQGYMQSAVHTEMTLFASRKGKFLPYLLRVDIYIVLSSSEQKYYMGRSNWENCEVSGRWCLICICHIQKRDMDSALFPLSTTHLAVGCRVPWPGTALQRPALVS
jgi:hypothetical protein